MNLIYLKNLVLACSILALSACSSSDDDASVAGGDTGSDSSGSSDMVDAGDTDAGDSDSDTNDEGGIDSGASDTDSTDEGDIDSAATDEGSADAGDTDAGSTNPSAQISCEFVTAAQLNDTGGVIKTVLPADLSVPSAQIEIQSQLTGSLISFDAQSGAIDYVPSASRLDSTIVYDIKDANNEVLATHEHQLIFQPVRIMPLGDSITAGVEFFDGSNDLPPMSERVGYRKFLYDRLLSEGYSVDFHGQGGQAAGAAAGLDDPENNGYPGVDIDFLNSKLIQQLTEDAVDVILLHIGTNNTPSNAEGIDTWLDTLDSWEATNNPVIAMVATIVPKRDDGLNAQVDLFNADLRQRISARTDDKVYLVEQNLALSVADLSAEPIGIHPSALGYQKMADAWVDGLVDAAVLTKCQ